MLVIYDEAVAALNFVARAFALGGVALFERINGNALANAQIFCSTRRSEPYRALYGQAVRFQPAFYHHYVEQAFAGRPAAVLVMHSLAFVVIVLALLSRAFEQTRKKHGECAAA